MYTCVYIYIYIYIYAYVYTLSGTCSDQSANVVCDSLSGLLSWASEQAKSNQAAPCLRCSPEEKDISYIYIYIYIYIIIRIITMIYNIIYIYIYMFVCLCSKSGVTLPGATWKDDPACRSVTPSHSVMSKTRSMSIAQRPGWPWAAWKAVSEQS